MQTANKCGLGIMQFHNRLLKIKSKQANMGVELVLLLGNA